MADRGKGKGKGNGGRETPTGNRPTPYPRHVRGVLPISRAATPTTNTEAYDYARQSDVDVPQHGVYTPRQLHGLAEAAAPVPPPPPIVNCPYCGQHTWQPYPQGGGGYCMNPLCQAFHDDNAGINYPGKIVEEQERQAERERCSKGSCSVMGGKTKRKKRKNKSRRRR